MIKCNQYSQNYQIYRKENSGMLSLTVTSFFIVVCRLNHNINNNNNNNINYHHTINNNYGSKGHSKGPHT